MGRIETVLESLEKLLREEGYNEFASVLRHASNESTSNQGQVYDCLKGYLNKIFKHIDDIAQEITDNNEILVSVKHQKVLRNSFQLISSLGVSSCLLPGIGIDLSKRCSVASVMPTLNLNYDEKYETLTQCSMLFERSYKIPVLKNIIMTFHLSDYLASLIQLAFAPLKKPGKYNDYIMTPEKYLRLVEEKQKFIAMYENLVRNCFQPMLMKELLVLQSVVSPSPPAFVKRVISKELSQRLLAQGGLLSLIRCFIESYDPDTGHEWKKTNMICQIVSTKHGTSSELDYLNNICSQLRQILLQNNTHYLSTAVACALSLHEKYTEVQPIKDMFKDLFQTFDYDNMLATCNLPGTIILTPQEVENRINILDATVNCIKIEWPVDVIETNLLILSKIGRKYSKNENIRRKITNITLKCLGRVTKDKFLGYLNQMLLVNKTQDLPQVAVEEYEAGLALKYITVQEENEENDALSYFLNIFSGVESLDLVQKIFEALLYLFIDLTKRRQNKNSKVLLFPEEDVEILDDIDHQYTTVLQLLTEVSAAPKVLSAIKKDPSVVLTFIEHFLSKSCDDDEDECITISLVLLNLIISNSKKEVAERCFVLIPVLKKIENSAGFNRMLCKEALGLISSNNVSPVETACSKAITDVFDNLLPVRAHGIMELTKLIEAKDPEALSKKHYLFCLFQEQLKDPDTYIYLSSINGIAALGVHCTEDVLAALCREYLQDIPTQHVASTTSEQINSNVETRMKIGDAIVKVTRGLGDMAIPHKSILVNTALCGCRHSDPLLRASALSNLAEIARVLHYRVGSIIYEILLCVWNIIETDVAVECRRAAVMVITSLIKGLGRETLVQLKENLLPTYRTLVRLYRDMQEDEVLRLHAQLALEELNDIVKEFLCPEVDMPRSLFVMEQPGKPVVVIDVLDTCLTLYVDHRENKQVEFQPQAKNRASTNQVNIDGACSVFKKKLKKTDV